MFTIYSSESVDTSVEASSSNLLNSPRDNQEIILPNDSCDDHSAASRTIHPPPMDVHPILAPSEIIAPSSNVSIPAINAVATIDENLVQTQVGLSTEDRIAVDEICAENIAYDNRESETTRYETQEEILADITRLSNDGYGRAVGNTGSGDEYSSEDSNNEAFTF